MEKERKGEARERQTETSRERRTERDKDATFISHINCNPEAYTTTLFEPMSGSVCVCVCVCVAEHETEQLID